MEHLLREAVCDAGDQVSEGPHRFDSKVDRPRTW
jgi:hypothetical protein